jgi:hypothetical protein
MLVGEVTITHPQTGHVFTFPQGMVFNVGDSFEVSPSQMKMPVSGPMANISNDFEGVGETITISGELFDLETLGIKSTTPSVVTGNNAPVIDKAEQMLYWLKSLCSGNQRAFEFTSPTCKKALLTSGGPGTEIAGALIPGNWVTPKGVIVAHNLDSQVGNIDAIPFSITIWVCGF